MKTKFSTLIFVLFCLSSIGYAQTGIGNYSAVDGGFENHTTDLKTLSTTAVNTLWTTNTGSTITRTVSSTGGRSGPKYVTLGPNGSGTAKNFYSPQMVGAFAPSSVYQIQFYYKSTSTTSLDVSTVDLYVDNTLTTIGTKQSIPAGITGSKSSWTKVAVAITTTASPTATTYGVVGLTIDVAGTSAAAVFSADIDDFIVYQADTPDIIAPNSPEAITAIGAGNGGANVSWGAANGGVDGGGYLVVRYATSTPSTTDDPNQNGIYKVSNTIGAGEVRYTGISTTFLDSGLTPGTNYYYKVYTVDKAFNYSNESTSPASQSASIAITGSFSPFAVALGSASTHQTITVVGADLTDVITVTAPTGFEVSTNETDYSSSKTVGTAGNSSSTLYLRIAAATAIGSYGSAGVSFVSGIATNSVACSGSVTANPILTTSELASFGSKCINTSSTANSFTITGVNLTTANVTVGPATGFTFSADGTTYSSSLSLLQSGGAYSKLIYVKFSPTSVQTFGSIPVEGGGVASSIGVTTTATAINTAVTAANGASNTVGTLIANISGTYTIGCSAITAYGIEYSATSGFANGAGTKAAGAGGATFTASISGLSPGTLYYYKVYATDGTETVYSSQSSFKTKFYEANSTGSFVYTPTGPLSSKPITVYYRIPAGDVTTMPILMSFHGDERNASDYRDYWTSMANANGFMVFAPEFKEADYPGGDGYQMGNVYVNGDSPSTGTLNPANQWTFSIIDPLFESIKTEVSGTQLTFKAWGHSGGAQFLQRFNLYMPNSKLDVSVCSNSGWYTVPDISVGFPYGTKNSELSNSSLAIPFSKKLIVHLGLNDTDPDSSGLRHNTTVDNQQGLNRLARGRYFFNTSQTISKALNYTYNWQRQEVAGVGHDPQAMANNALTLLFQTTTTAITYTNLDGGFEGHATGNIQGGSSSAVNLSATTWSASTTPIGSITRTISGTGGRTGPQYASFGSLSTAAKSFYTPRMAGAFASNTKYQIQFWYKPTTTTATLTSSSIDLYVDNASATAAPASVGTKQTVAAGLTTTATDWAKVALQLTTNGTAAGSYGVAAISFTTAATATNFTASFDDFVIYAGDLDTTAPSAPSAVVVSGVSGGANVSWSAASGGVDGGGYLVVRYATSSPSASDDPNQNGIYAKGNIIGAGEVRYIGTSNSFTDSGLSPDVDYYYKVYTVDKAFNYSNESQSAAVQSVATTYYYKGTGLLTDLSSWGLNTNGSGNTPTDFISDSQVFEIRNTSSVALDGLWTVSGTGSKVRIGNTTQPAVTLTLNLGASIGPVSSGNVDVVSPISGHQTVVYKGTTAVSFGNIFDSNLEVVYDGVTVSSASTKSFGTVTILNGAIVTFTATPIIKNITVDASSTLVAPTSASSAYITIPSGGSVTINGTVKIPKLTGFVSSSVGTSNDTFGDFQFIGTENLTLGANSTVEYVRTTTASTQTVTARTDYKNLTLSGTTAKTINGSTTIAGTFTVNQTASATAVILSGDLTVNGILSFVSGKISTGSNALTVGTSGSITGAGSGTGWVIGNLKKGTVSGSNPSYTYAIGDAANYLPLALTFSGTTTAAGSLMVSTASGEHASIATSGIYTSKSVNRNWTLTNSGLTGFGNYNAAFTFANTDNDVDATPSNYGVHLYRGTSWSYLTTTGTSSSAATAAGISFFGEFAIGEFVGAPAAESQTFCNSGTVANLVTSGTATKWYATAIGGTALASDLTLVSGTYYVSQTIGGIESTRTAVAVVVNLSSAPAVEPQVFCSSATVASLVTSGEAPKWYSNDNGGSALASDDVLISGNYYVSQTLNGCESSRSVVAVTINVITSQPVSTPICKVIGGTAVLSVASANPNATYQWQAQLPTGTTWANVTNPSIGIAIYTGDTSAALSIRKQSLVLPLSLTKYRVVVSGSCNTANTSSVVTITDTALPTEVLSAITSATEVAATPGTYVAATKAVGPYVGTETTVSYRVNPFTGSNLTYFWIVPAGVSIVGQAENVTTITQEGVNANILNVNFKNVSSGIGTIGSISVQAQNASGCKTAAKTVILSKAFPAAPATIKMTDINVPPPASGIYPAVTSFAKYMGTPAVLTVTAGPLVGASSYVWELPEGVTVLSGATTTSGVTSGTSNLITIDFAGVTKENTFNYNNTTPAVPVPTNVLRIGVKSVNGVGASVTDNSKLANASELFYPNSTSSAKLLTLTAIKPAAPGSIKIIDASIVVAEGKTAAAVTDVSKYVGTLIPLTVTATTSALASSYVWELPEGVNAVSGSNRNSASVQVTLDGTIVDGVNNLKGVSSLYIGVKAINGINPSVTDNSLLSPATPSTAKLLKVTAKAAATPGAITTPLLAVPKFNPTCATGTEITVQVPNVSGVTYAWTVAGVSVDNGGSNSIVIPVSGIVTSTLSVSVIATNGVGSSAPKTIAIAKTTSCSARMASKEVSTDEFSVIVYPNPSSDVFNIDVQSSGKGVTEVKVYDMAGRLIENRQVNSNSFEIGRNYASGTYNVIVTQDANVKSLRVIKK